MVFQVIYTLYSFLFVKLILQPLVSSLLHCLVLRLILFKVVMFALSVLLLLTNVWYYAALCCLGNEKNKFQKKERICILVVKSDSKFTVQRNRHQALINPLHVLE